MADEPEIATSVAELPVDQDPPPDGDDSDAEHLVGKLDPAQISHVTLEQVDE